MSVALSYDLIHRNLDRTLTQTAAKGSVKLETEHYLKALSKISSVDDFLSDTRAFTFAMTAYGLQDFAFAKGYMRKVLEEGVSDPRSLANRTTDLKIKEFAKAFNFADFGGETMTRPAVGQAVVDRYVRQSLEVEAGEKDGEGVRLALYFERMAGSIKNPYDILADEALAKVVRVALGLPDEIAAANIEKQAALIEKRIDLEELADPDELARFLTRFTTLWDATEGVSSDPILSLFGGGSRSPTVSLDLALSFSSFRLGGR